MNLNMPFEDDSLDLDEMTIEEFKKTKLTIEEPVDRLEVFIDRVRNQLKSDIHYFTHVQRLEVSSLRIINSRQEDTIEKLEEQIDDYRKRLIKLQEITEKEKFSKKQSKFEADLKYFARL